MSGNKASVSGGRSYQEIGDYWDQHDAGDLLDSSQEVQFEVDLQSERHYYSIDRALARRISHLAHERGVSPETLVNLWVQEKLTESGS